MIFLLGGLFLLADQFLKWMSLHRWVDVRVWGNLIGWAPFLNPGIAFGIPVPNVLVLILTIPVIVLILYAIYRETLESQGGGRSLVALAALVSIFVGATSNLIDRLAVRHTIDYIQIFTAVINVADVMIVGGFVTYLLILKSKK